MAEPTPDALTADAPASGIERFFHRVMATCLGVMAVVVFLNVVLRYGFGGGVAASEELSRLLFIWVVFIGATLAYRSGEHMAFTGLVGLLRSRPLALRVAAAVIRLLVLLACVLLARGAWQQVLVGLDSHSVVLGYSTALQPLPALLCAVAIGAMACMELLRGAPLRLGHGGDVE